MGKGVDLVLTTEPELEEGEGENMCLRARWGGRW